MHHKTHEMIEYIGVIILLGGLVLGYGTLTIMAIHKLINCIT